MILWPSESRSAMATTGTSGDFFSTRWLIGGLSSGALRPRRGWALGSREPLFETIYGGARFCAARELRARIAHGTGVVEGSDESTQPRDDGQQHGPSSQSFDSQAAVCATRVSFPRRPHCGCANFTRLLGRRGTLRRRGAGRRLFAQRWAGRNGLVTSATP